MTLFYDSAGNYLVNSDVIVRTFKEAIVTVLNDEYRDCLYIGSVGAIYKVNRYNITEMQGEVSAARFCLFVRVALSDRGFAAKQLEVSAPAAGCLSAAQTAADWWKRSHVWQLPF